jgi:hypothetical protein
MFHKLALFPGLKLETSYSKGPTKQDFFHLMKEISQFPKCVFYLYCMRISDLSTSTTGLLGFNCLTVCCCVTWITGLHISGNCMADKG